MIDGTPLQCLWKTKHHQNRYHNSTLPLNVQQHLKYASHHFKSNSNNRSPSNENNIIQATLSPLPDCSARHRLCLDSRTQPNLELLHESIVLDPKQPPNTEPSSQTSPAPSNRPLFRAQIFKNFTVLGWSAVRDRYQNLYHTPRFR